MLVSVLRGSENHTNDWKRPHQPLTADIHIRP